MAQPMAIAKGCDRETTDKNIRIAIDRELPEITGWTRKVTVGGVLCNATVSYQRKTDMFAGSIVVFVSLSDHGTYNVMTYDVTAHLGEKLPGDEHYYAFDGSYLNRLGTVRNARVKLKTLADERRAIAQDFV